MTARPTALTTLPLTALALTALLLAGCSGAGSSGDAAGAESGSSTAALDTGGVAAPQVGGGGGTTTTDVDLRAVPGAAVIRTADLSVDVDDVTRAADEAGRLVRAAGGEVEAEERSGGTGPRYASLRLRVPPAELDRTVTALGALGEETGRRLGTEDVTEQVVDLEARLATQRAGVERVRALLERADGLAEVVQVEAELTRRTADLESLQARLAALDAQVDLATVSLSLQESGDGPAAGGALGPADGLRGGWEALLTAGRLLGVAVGALLPFVPLVLGGLLLVRRLRRPGPLAG